MPFNGNRISRRDAVKGIAGASVAGLSGCLGIGGGSSDVPTVNFALTVPHNELAGTLFESEHVRENVLQYYGDEYETQLSSVGGSPIAVSSVGSGDADIGGFAFSSAASAAQEEAVPAGFTIIAGSMWQGVGDYFSQTAASSADSDITEIGDLEGKVLAVNTRGAGSDLNARKVLADNGLTYEDDVGLQELGFGAQPTAVKEGRVDAAVLTQPFWYDNQDELNFLFDGGDSLDVSQPFVFNAIRNDFLEENGEVVEYLLEDYWAALEWWFSDENREQVLDVAVDVAGYGSREIADVLVGTEEDFYKGQNGISVSPEGLQASWDMMQELGFLDGDLNATDYVDNSYLPSGATLE